MTDIQKEKIFAISHILRELGYHKESTHYFVKPKGEKATLLRMNFSNCWNFKHRDWNRHGYYAPSNGKTWDFHGTVCIPCFADFGKSGYICSIPNDEQIISFSKRNGIELHDMTKLSVILSDMISAYRMKTDQVDAFRKYEPLTICE